MIKQLRDQVNRFVATIGPYPDAFQRTEMIWVLKIANIDTDELHHTDGVSEDGWCKKTPTKRVTLPYRQALCKGCMKDLTQQREGGRRYPVRKCRQTQTPDDFNW